LDQAFGEIVIAIIFVSRWIREKKTNSQLYALLFFNDQAGPHLDQMEVFFVTVLNKGSAWIQL